MYRSTLHLRVALVLAVCCCYQASHLAAATAGLDSPPARRALLRGAPALATPCVSWQAVGSQYINGTFKVALSRDGECYRRVACGRWAVLSAQDIRAVHWDRADRGCSGHPWARHAHNAACCALLLFKTGMFLAVATRTCSILGVDVCSGTQLWAWQDTVSCDSFWGVQDLIAGATPRPLPRACACVCVRARAYGSRPWHS